MKELTKTLILMSSLSLQYSIATAQENLVPNPSFEAISLCPSGQAQINLVNGWGNFGGTPDYFNKCAIDSHFSVPNTWAGFQETYNGDGFVGIGLSSSLQQNFSEYIGVQLNQPLANGQRYYVSCRISLGLNNQIGFTGASNNFGMLFSTVQFSANTPPYEQFCTCK